MNHTPAHARCVTALATLLVAAVVHAEQMPPVAGSPPVAGEVVPTPQPKAVSNVAPEYPKAEQAAGHGGRVVLHFKVTETGAIESVEVAKGTEYPALDAAALEAGKKWRFEAAKDESGKPVASEATYALNFKSQGGGVARSCADLNDEVSLFRANSPDADIGQMKSFAAMTGLFVMSMSSEPIEKRLATVKRLKDVYPKIAERCEREPAAVYADVFADELMQLKKQ